METTADQSLEEEYQVLSARQVSSHGIRYVVVLVGSQRNTYEILRSISSHNHHFDYSATVNVVD